jgi:acylphosphatase
MTRHYSITVKGRVQGVSYRFAAHSKALKLSLTGLVKNMANGDVYIEAEGKEEDINKLIEWCYVGPPLAKVEEVIAVEDKVKEYRNFEIKR